MHASRLKRLVICISIAAFVAAMVVLPVRAQATVVLDVYDENYTPQNPVADNITRLYVNKLDKSSRDHVKGAMLCIINEETGEIVGEPWTSDGSAHEIARNVQGIGKDGALDIDTWYILKELKVPEGYSSNFKDLQDDPNTPHLIRFRIHSDDFNTTGELEVDDAISEFVESEDIHGTGPEQAFVINLYNESIKYVEEQETRTRKNDTENQDEVEKQNTNNTNTQTQNQNSTTTKQTTSNQTTNTQSGTVTSTSSTTSGGGSLTQTGDNTSYVPIIVIVVIAAGIIGFAIYKRRQ